jgi:hypothetical protein
MLRLSFGMPTAVSNTVVDFFYHPVCSSNFFEGGVSFSLEKYPFVKSFVLKPTDRTQGYYSGFQQ